MSKKQSNKFVSFPKGEGERERRGGRGGREREGRGKRGEGKRQTKGSDSVRYPLSSRKPHAQRPHAPTTSSTKRDLELELEKKCNHINYIYIYHVNKN